MATSPVDTIDPLAPNVRGEATGASTVSAVAQEAAHVSIADSVRAVLHVAGEE